MVSPTRVQFSNLVEVPFEQVAASHVSVPGWDRLQALPGLVGQPVNVIENSLRAGGSKLCGLTGSKLHDALLKLQKRLAVLHSETVWLADDLLEVKPEYAEHLRPFCQGASPSTFGFGLRDTWQNRFKPAFMAGRGTLARPGEPLAHRPYTVLYSAGNDHTHIAIGKGRFTGSGIDIQNDNRPVRFAVAGTPLVEEGKPVPAETRVGYQADLRHEFHLPPSTWPSIHRPLQQLVESDPDPIKAGTAVLNEAAAQGLQQERGYYLGSIGVSDTGLIFLSAHGSVDTLAQLQISAGARHAILTEEGGSNAYALWECQKDFQAPNQVKTSAGQPLWEAAPRYFGMTTYWRPFAMVLGVLQLKSFLTETPFIEESPWHPA